MEAVVFNLSYWIETLDFKATIEHLELCLKECEFSLISKQEKEFEPIGYTAIWLLGESHFAIHTFPEKNKIYIELCSCNLEKLELFSLMVDSTSIFKANLRYKYI